MSSFNKAFEDMTIGELKKLHETYLKNILEIVEEDGTD